MNNDSKHEEKSEKQRHPHSGENTSVWDEGFNAGLKAAWNEIWVHLPRRVQGDVYQKLKELER